MVSQTEKDRLERIQRSASRTCLPNNEDQERLYLQNLPTLCAFILSLGERHPDQSLFSRSIFNTGRISSHNDTIFRPAACRTHKLAKPIFPCTCPVPTKNDFSNHIIFLNFCEPSF